MCRTLAGNECPLLTITEFNDDDNMMMKKKRGIVITARVHPGETNSSLMMEGLIYFLTSDTAHAHVRFLAWQNIVDDLIMMSFRL